MKVISSLNCLKPNAMACVQMNPLYYECLRIISKLYIILNKFTLNQVGFSFHFLIY